MTYSDTRKYIGSIILGVAGYAGLIFSASIEVSSCHYEFPWTMIFPLLAAIAWGWESGLVASASGIITLLFFRFNVAVTWPFLITSLFYTLWVSLHGFFAGKRKTTHSRIYIIYIVQLVFQAIDALLFLVWLGIISHNKDTTTSTLLIYDRQYVIRLFIKDMINMFVIVILSDVLFVLPSIRKLFMQVKSPFSVYTHWIMFFSLITGFILYFFNFHLDQFVLHHTSGLSPFPTEPAEQIQLILFIIFSLLVGSLISRFVEHRIELESYLENNRRQLELVIQNKVEELELAQEELKVTNQELVNVNKELHQYQLELERMVEQKMKELDEEQQFKSTILDSINSVVVVLDNRGKIISVNKNCEQVSGYTMEEVEGKDYVDLLIPPAEKEMIRTIISDFNKSYENISIRNHLSTHSGSKRLFLWNYNCILDSRDKLKFIIGSGSDLTERTMLFEALKEREEGYKTLFDNMTSALAVYKPVWDSQGIMTDFMYMDMNPAFESLTGINAEQSKGKTQKELMPGSMNDLGIFNNIIRSGNPVKNEFYAKHLNKFISVSTFKYKDGFASIMEDISERKKAEEALKISEEKFRHIFESSKDGMVISTDNKIVEINPSLLQMLKYSRQDVIGQPALNYIQPLYHDAVKLRTKNMYEGKAVGPFEVQMYSKKDELLPFEFNSQLITYDGRQSILTIVRDITERKKAESALRISEEKFRNIFNTTKDAIIISNLERVILDANNTFFETLGIEREELGKLRTTDLIPPFHQEKLMERIREMIMGRVVPGFEIEITTHTGMLIPVEINSHIIDYEGKRAVLSIIKDIRYRREMERQLFETIVQTEEAERKRFAADLHDEIGPLLSSIRIFVSTLNNQDISAEVNKVLQRVTDIVKETVVKIREISHNLSPHLIENHGLDTAIKSEVENRRDIISIDYQSNISEFRFDSKIEIVFYRIVKELIQNTIKHSRATSIIITLQINNGILKLFYHDNGTGFNVDEVLARSAHGIGMMNIISRVKSVKGNYSINSTPVGGSTFEITVNTSLA